MFRDRLFRSCSCSAVIILSFVASWLVRVEFVFVNVDNRSLSAVAAISRFANASAVSL
jgi:hypothetical protein